MEQQKKKVNKGTYDPVKAKKYNAYRNEYSKKNLKLVVFRLNKNNEVDQKIIDRLRSRDNQTEYLRNLILEDMRLEHDREMRAIRAERKRKN